MQAYFIVAHEESLPRLKTFSSKSFGLGTGSLFCVTKQNMFRHSSPRGPRKNSKKDASASFLLFAGPRGLEPRSARLECDILPLNYGPKILLSRLTSIPKKTKKWNFRSGSISFRNIFVNF